MSVATALLALAWCGSETVAAAGEWSAAEQSGGQTVYSTGRNGSRLKWGSSRPASVEQGRLSVTPTQYVEPNPACEPSCGVRTVQNQQPTVSPGPIAPIQPPAVPRNGKTKQSPQTLLDRTMGTKRYDFSTACPSAKPSKPIGSLTTNIAPSEGDLPKDCPLGDDVFQPRHFSPITYTWTASGLCHKPLYFEDVQLERYGHMAGPWVQPFASAAHFFATIPILPYKMGLEPPLECMYTLGYYRPGSCAPYLFDPIPLSLRGAVFEAGGWVAGALMF
jgi:hypothetical protein